MSPSAASSSTAGSLGEPAAGSGQSTTSSATVGAANGAAHQWVFWTLDQGESKAVMDLCVGSHELYVWRRRPETLEMQQIKAQAREERARKESERSRLSREREEKVAALEAKSALEGRCAELEMALRRSEETAELWAEKANVAEEEARLLQKKADQTAEALNRFHAVHVDLESRARDAAAAAHALESRQLVARADPRLAGVDASSGEQLFLPMSPPLPRRSAAAVAPPVGVEPLPLPLAPISVAQPAPAAPEVTDLTEFELTTASSEQLLAALERERKSFQLQNVQLQRQLCNLRSEVDRIKNEHRQFSLERLPFAADRIIGHTVVTKFPSAQQVWSSRAPSKSVES